MYKNGGKIPGGSIDLSPQTSHLGKKCHWQDSRHKMVARYLGKLWYILLTVYGTVMEYYWDSMKFHGYASLSQFF